jgi:predicted transcriptional regulator
MTAAVQEPAGLEQLLGTVGDAMTGAVVLLAADMPAEHALRRLDQQAVSGAPVVDRGRVVGVITRRDLLVPIPEQGSYESPLAGLRACDLMSPEPVTAGPDWPLVRAVRAGDLGRVVRVDHGLRQGPGGLVPAGRGRRVRLDPVRRAAGHRGGAAPGR